jgi:A/G-specific adenine glycosylase
MAKTLANREHVARLRAALLEWYSRHRRDLPWRRTRDPYAIWVSEIMLQQTRVAAVVDRYEQFMLRFPTVFALAEAAEQDVLALWSGLGYYRRARMLHKAARAVAAIGNGKMPGTAAELRALPGVGAYTAAAVASIAFNEPVAVVDGNVERVLCRVAAWDADGEHERKVYDLAGRLVDPDSPGDFNQAMMELGATVCLPRNPQCLACPLAGFCKTRGEHRTAPRARSVVREVGYALCLRSAHKGPRFDLARAQVLLQQRPPHVSVMPGMWELPMLLAVPNGDTTMTVRHAIMNVNYVVRIRHVGEEELPRLAVDGGARRWVPFPDAGGMALTGLARKVLTRVKGTPPTQLHPIVPSQSHR